MAKKTNNGKYWRAEHFVTSLLASPSALSYNTMFMVRYTHPNFCSAKTSFMLENKKGDLKNTRATRLF